MNQQKTSTTFAFIMITSLFFLWGFVHNLDPILIPHLKKSFSLTNLQASLVDFAVFIGYFLMALPAGLIMKKHGYKSGILVGLSLFAVGSFLFIPAANTQLYAFFLAALFIIACGLTILETAANPYASLLGSPEKATQRLNFAQSFNGLAATVAPIIGSKLILTKGYSEAELATMTEQARQVALASEAATVKTPYLVLGLVLVVVAIIFALIKLPEIKDGDEDASLGRVFHALKHKHLKGAVLAQFAYVGAQVCVFSLFILFATKAFENGHPEQDPFIQNISGLFKKLGLVNESGENHFAYYLSLTGLAFMIGRFIGTFLMKYIQPPTLLAAYAVINVALCVLAATTHGATAVYSVVAIAFFMSIMFPTIFSLGIHDLGTDTKFGSSLIIMSIVGGAIVPPIMAFIGDATGNIQLGYIVPLVCFAVIAWFGFKGYKTA